MNTSFRVVNTIEQSIIQDTYIPVDISAPVKTNFTPNTKCLYAKPGFELENITVTPISGKLTVQGNFVSENIKCSITTPGVVNDNCIYTFTGKSQINPVSKPIITYSDAEYGPPNNGFLYRDGEVANNNTYTSRFTYGEDPGKSNATVIYTFSFQYNI